MKDNKSELKMIECPRDAMQGLPDFINTPTKAEYINLLLQVGFDTIDFGSFVSAKAIPQMRDTAAVLGKLNLDHTETKLLAIVANERGANEALVFDEIDYLGYPFSISEEFQKRNTGKGIEDSLRLVEQMQNICISKNKELVVYLSMAFGNPYGELWDPEIAIKWSGKLIEELGVKTLALSDTIGVSNPYNISALFNALIPAFPSAEIGAHLHTEPNEWHEKVEAAWLAGCRRFDGALKGFGGCPMAKDDLVGNMPTENLVNFAEDNGIETGIDQAKLIKAMNLAARIMG
jgi:hydroxymethylglutaryl-CoA lyase